MEKLKEMASRFALEGEVEEVVPLGAGLINDSYRVKTVAEETPDYVLQRINHAIFQDVDLLQENIRRITEHIRRKLEARGERDTERKTLTVVPAKDGKLYVSAMFDCFDLTVLGLAEELKTLVWRYFMSSPSENFV